MRNETNLQTEIQTEICVIGGGPAGSAVARRLALLGHQVHLVEREKFPRSHIGESLLPGIIPLLELLGVREQVENAGFLRPTKSIIRWTAATDLEKSQPGPAGFQVDRGHFDQLLLEAAKEAGVSILQPATAFYPLHQAKGAWLIPIKTKGTTQKVHCRFLVDAAGRHSILRGKKRRFFTPTLAVYAYWRETGIQGMETRVEAGANQWYWGAPLPDGSFNATVFIDPKRSAAAGRPGLEELYLNLISQSTLLKECLEGKLHTKILACDASCRMDENTVDEDWIKIGEAACSIDPLSSQGVRRAIQTGIQGAAVVHTILNYSENATAALEFYRLRQNEMVLQHQSFAQQFYAEHQTFCSEPFWQKRAKGQEMPNKEKKRAINTSPFPKNCRLQLSEAAVLVDTPTLQGDMILNCLSLTHPNLDRPVAFLNGIHVGKLIDPILEGLTASEVLENWSDYLDPRPRIEILQWFWAHGVIIDSTRVR